MCETTARFLSTREVAAAMGVGESSVKRWIDAGSLRAERTPGGHRRVLLADLYAFMRSTGRKLVAPEVLGLSDPASKSASPVEVCQASLQDGDGPTFESVLQMLRLSESAPAAILDKVVYPAFQALRATCQHPSEECMVLHRALLMLQTGLKATMSPDEEFLSDARPRVVLADIGYEVDSAPTLFAEAAVWDQARCLQLGANVPATVVEGALAAFRADVLWVSASGPARPSAIKADLQSILDRAAQAKVRVVLFGDALPRKLGDTEIRVHSFSEFRGFVSGLAA